MEASIRKKGLVKMATGFLALIGAGYFVMLEPLGPGDHRIEWGAFRVAQDVIDSRSIVNVHVKEAAAE